MSNVLMFSVTVRQFKPKVHYFDFMLYNRSTTNRSDSL